MQTPAYYLINIYLVMYAVCGSSTALMLVDIIFDGGHAPMSPVHGKVPDNEYQVPDPRASGDSGGEVVPHGSFQASGNYSGYEYPLDVATYYYGPHFLMATIATITTGHLIDSGVHEKYLLFGAGVMLSIGLGTLSSVKDPVSAILCGTVRGLSIGLREPVRLSMLGKYFGNDHLAEITGSTKMYHMLGLAAGPLIITVCRDWDGTNYAVTLNFFAVCCLAISVCMLLLQQPVHPSEAIDPDTLARTLAQAGEGGVEEGGEGSLNSGLKSGENSPRKSLRKGGSTRQSENNVRPYQGRVDPI